MAIGLGRMFGFRFAENFNYPYISRSATEFWQRWHISLGSWFRDYVYIPLGGNRVSKWHWIGNLFIVWLLTGIWHGANWTFLCWGLFYFVLLVIEKLTDFPKRLGFFAHVYALIAIICGWTIFRAEDLTRAGQYLAAMFGQTSAGLMDETFWMYLSGSASVMALGCLLSLPVWPFIQQRFSHTWLFQYGEPIWATGIFFLATLICISASYNPFIYFNF